MTAPNPTPFGLVPILSVVGVLMQEKSLECGVWSYELELIDGNAFSTKNVPAHRAN
jgi:hypothetical protein